MVFIVINILNINISYLLNIKTLMVYLALTISIHICNTHFKLTFNRSRDRNMYFENILIYFRIGTNFHVCLIRNYRRPKADFDKNGNCMHSIRVAASQTCPDFFTHVRIIFALPDFVLIISPGMIPVLENSFSLHQNRPQDFFAY